MAACEDRLDDVPRRTVEPASVFTNAYVSQRENMTRTKSLYEKRLGRLSFLETSLRWLLGLELHRLAKRHIAEKRRQLVVFSFDHIATLINLDGIYEKKYLDAFFEWLDRLNVDTRNSVAIDVGANIGNHSLYFSDRFRKVHSFEPNPRTYKVLCLNAELAGNIECHGFGLSDSERCAVLSVDPGNVGGASITESPAADSQAIELRTLDSLGDIQEVGLMKIDVEGHELAVINGARSVIARHKPIILFEQHIEDFENGRSPVLTVLKELGYKRFATVMMHPHVSGGMVKRLLTLPVLGAIWGESIAIRLDSDIRPGFYSFIVALPDGFPAMGDPS